MNNIMPSVQVRHMEAPPQFSKPKSIHPRHVLPFVAEGKERDTHSLSPRSMIEHPQDDSQTIEIFLNTQLDQPAQKRTSANVNEPSVSMNGDVVFYTSQLVRGGVGRWWPKFQIYRSQ